MTLPLQELGCSPCIGDYRRIDATMGWDAFMFIDH